MKKNIFYFLLIVSFVNIQAKVSLPEIFSSHMVLQQKSEVIIWGWANPLENVKVVGSWNNDTSKMTADNQAKWQVTIKTPAAGGPYSITVAGSDTITLEDVMIGEVWLCSGQSNMEMSASWGINNAAQEISEADYPDIRLFQVDKRAAEYPQLDVAGTWKACTPKTMKDFSAAGYFFGRDLYKNLNVPIGLINSSWGGTPAETWVNPDTISSNKILSESAKKISDTMPWCPGKPGKTYNSMIYPLIPFKIAGVIWYQGETNTANPETYSQLFSTLIKDWRNEWEDEFPFYYVQIAPYNYETPYTGVLVREAQLKCLTLPKTGMVVISDIGNLKDIHPKDKQDVGKRLANWALANTYGKKDINVSGPLYRSFDLKGNKIIIYFNFAGSGLAARGGALTNFTIAGKDSVFVPAKAEIEDSTVVVYSDNIQNPIAVRYAWENAVDPNLFNKEGLPASSFRTDDWKIQLK
ncbi:MAG: sialate O-acetylesterase [Ignavibacteriaceae bacterium]